MAEQYLIGLDIGTSGAKCILVNRKGTVVASATREYPLDTPRAGWAEQDPADWWRAVAEGCRAILNKAQVPTEAIVALSLSGQMHGLVALDRERRVIRPSILWCDQRTQKQCDALTERAGGPEKLLTYTNNQMLTGYTGGKILWLKEEESDNFARMDVFCCPKDYIRLLLTGEVATDVSDGSGTGFFDTKNRRWSDELIALAGLDKRIFPPVLESTALAGRVTGRAAEETGLPEGLKVYAGGGDAVIQTTGSGLVRPGVLGVVIGTAGNVAMGFTGFHENPAGKLQMFANNEPGLYHALGCTLAAGSAYRWFRDTLCERQIEAARAQGLSAYDLMGESAEASRPGANGVVFLPYLAGERCPYPDPNARGVFYGMSLATSRCDMTRAVMEGVTYSLRQVAELFTRVAPSEKVYSSGGGSASKLWRQIQADVFGLPVYTMSAASEGGAYGAVLVAGVGAGVWKDLNEAISVLSVETETLPNGANRAAYEDAYGLYCDLYPALKPVFDKGAR
ncbi:MAG: xylulokinase [Eubacteriales bacterium]|nr:xylulokinase [Christensenellaceae bacterium]MEA5064460.1 xylulokinase [Eubacteriales bacterium]